MKYQSFASLKLPVSKIILGTSTEKCRRGENCDEVFDKALQLGITTFDTARVYGKSEEIIGDWMERKGVRERVNILSKGGHHSPLLIKRLKEKDILFDVQLSLQKLKTDYIDIYLLHRDDPSLPVDGMVETLNSLYAQGKIKAFGCSNWTKERIEKANEYAYKHNLVPFAFSSPYYGLAEMKESFFAYGLKGLTGAEKEAERAWYQQTQMPVFAYSTLANGLFTDKVEKPAQLQPFWVKAAFGNLGNFARRARCKVLAEKKGCSISQLAIAWSLHSEMNVFPIVGASRMESLQSSFSATKIVLTEEEYAYLNEGF